MTVSTGATAGFATMTANAAGPVTTIYLIRAGLPMLRMIGTGAWFYLVVNLAKVPFSAGLGLITPTSLVRDALLVPALLLGAALGILLVEAPPAASVRGGRSRVLCSHSGVAPCLMQHRSPCVPLPTVRDDVVTLWKSLTVSSDILTTMSAPTPGLDSLPRFVVDRKSPVPLYFQVAQHLEDAIHSGAVPTGTLFQNEVDLAASLGLSRPTMRRAMQHLVDKGLVVRRRGIGTRVVQPKLRRSLELTSLYDDLTRAGRKPTTEVLSFEKRRGER